MKLYNRKVYYDIILDKLCFNGGLQILMIVLSKLIFLIDFTAVV